MARSSSRNRVVAAFISAIVVATSGAASAHRRDEYLQAARIALEPDHVRVELDLTAGISVADALIRDIDRDGSGWISGGEARTYATTVLKTMRLEVDHRPLQVELMDVAVPDLEAIRNGEGAIRLELGARLPALAAGPHQMFFLNGHRPDIGVYLANALVPVSPRVEVAAQRRDVAQREIMVDYVLNQNASVSGRALLSMAALAIVLFAAAGWLRERS